MIKDILPKPLKRFLRRCSNTTLDILDKITGNYNTLIPKRNEIFIGNGNFEKTGDEFFQYFVKYCKIQPSNEILDVGCGQGRMALPLTQYLNKEGNYQGFDIVEKGIRWCDERITSKYPRFKFFHANIYNKYYNPKGITQSSKYVFPLKDQSFDFVFLTSVFTHMFPDDMANYIEQIHRVMKPKGIFFATYFLINEESKQLIKTHKSEVVFGEDLGGYCTRNNDIPEDAIAIPEGWLKELYKTLGLRIEEPILYGSWCGRKNHISYQDIIIASKI